MRLWSNHCAGIVTSGRGSFSPVSASVNSIIMNANVPLGFQVAVVDPEPVIPVADRDEGVAGLALAAVDPDESRRPAIVRETFPARRHAALGQVGGRHFDLRGHRLHQVKDRPGKYRHFLVVRGGRAEHQLETGRFGVEAEQATQLAAVLLGFG